MNDLANYIWMCFSKSFSQISLAHPDFKVLDLNIHVKHVMHFFPLRLKNRRIFNKRLLFSQLFSGSFIEGQRCDGKTLIQELSIQHQRGILMNSLFVYTCS